MLPVSTKSGGSVPTSVAAQLRSGSASWIAELQPFGDAELVTAPFNCSANNHAACWLVLALFTVYVYVYRPEAESKVTFVDTATDS
jgi:hypothetical protein